MTGGRRLPPVRVASLLFLTTAVPIAVALFLLVGREGHLPWTPLLLMAVTLAAAAWRFGRAEATPAGERVARWWLILASVNLVAFWPEVLLRAAGFRYEGGVGLGFAPGPHAFRRYVPDSMLFWRWDPRVGVNSLGYPAPEPAVPKPAGAFRVLYLGDSCTWDSYPELAEPILNAALAGTGRFVETINLAVPGYSSHQGRILAERHAESLRPDLVVIKFGWNDHWAAIGAPDAAKVVRVPSGPAATADALFRRLRTLQLAAWAVDGVRPDPAPTGVRVPLPVFKANLERMGRAFEEHGAVVLLITPPTSHYRLGVDERLVRVARFAPTPETIITHHREYAQATREVAAERGWHLLDLERDLAGHPGLDRLFWADGIHYRTPGKALIATLVGRQIQMAARLELAH